MDNVLPHRVIKNKSGHCIALTTLGLLLTEKWHPSGITASLVRAPEHAFQRVCDQKSCVNIEMLKKGQNLKDAEYISRLAIPMSAVTEGQYLSPLQSPDDVYASLMTAYGYALSRNGNSDGAIRAYSLAIKRAPWADTYSNRGAVQFSAGKPELASKDFADAIRLNPDLYSAWLNQAVLSYRSGDYAQATESASRVIALRPTSMQPYLILGNILESDGDSVGAAREFKKAWMIQPDSCAAATGLRNNIKAIKESAEKQTLQKQLLSTLEKCK